jgi:hypothetical protein
MLATLLRGATIASILLPPMGRRKPAPSAAAERGGGGNREVPVRALTKIGFDAVAFRIR